MKNPAMMIFDRHTIPNKICRTIVLVSLFVSVSSEDPTWARQSTLVNRQSNQREEAEETQWYQWRGPLATGEAPNANPPVEWSENKNIKWKTAIPGVGHSTPVVTATHVFLTAAVPTGKRFKPRPDTAPGAHDNKQVDSKYDFVGIAIDRKTGKIIWQKTLHSAIPHEGSHYSGSLASASPATDGSNVFFYFGSYGVYCLTSNGEVKWKRGFGPMNTKHAHGEGSSPVLHGSTLAINWDHEDNSFVVALDKETGDQIWRKPRDEVTSWSSPIVVELDGKNQLIIAGTKRLRSYDLANGQIIWQCGGLSNNVVASPVYANGMVFAGSSYDTKQMMGIRIAGARGDISTTDRVVWSKVQRTPYVPSPLLVDGALYYLRHYQGVMTRIVAATGAEPSGPFRLPRLRDIYASPVAASGRIYVTDRLGSTVVMTTDAEPKMLSVNRLQDRISASAAIAGKQIFLRGELHLYCIEETDGH